MRSNEKFVSNGPIQQTQSPLRRPPLPRSMERFQQVKPISTLLNTSTMILKRKLVKQRVLSPSSKLRSRTSTMLKLRVARSENKSKVTRPKPVSGIQRPRLLRPVLR